MKKIAFYATNITGFTEMMKVARLMNEKRDYEFTFILNSHFEGDFKQKLTEQVASVKSRIAYSGELVPEFKEQKSMLGSLYKSFLARTDNSSGFSKTKYQLAKQKCAWRIEAYETYVKQQSFDLLILPEDGPGADFALLKAFKLARKPILVMPYEYSGYNQLLLGARRCIKYRKEDFDKKYWSAIEQYYFYESGFYYGFAEIEEYMAWEHCGALPPNLKTVHGGMADKLCAESEKMVEHYTREKLPAKKLVLTGAMSDDVLYENLKNKEAIKNRLEKDINQPINKPIVVFSFIPDSPYDTQKVFADYRDYVVSITNTLSRLENYQVVYQFHPAVNQQSRQVLSDRGLPATSIPTAELITIADLYVTSYSSTIRWAIACVVPVINFDIYDFRFEDFDRCKGVKGIRSKESFNALIDEINKDGEVLRRLKNYQAEDSGKWAIFDGQSGQRISNFIQELCEH